MSSLSNFFKKKKVIIPLGIVILAAIVCLFVFTTGKQPTDPSVASNDPVDSQPTSGTDADGKLTAYVYDPLANDLAGMIHLYNLTCGDSYQIEVTEFKNETEMNQVLSAELMSGNGPDLFWIQNGDPYSVRQYMEKGAFYDLNQFIEKDDDFSMSDYYPIIMEAGQLNEKQFLLPISYSVDNVFLTTDEVLKANEITLPHPFTYQNLHQVLDPFLQEPISVLPFFIIPDMPDLSSFINYEDKTNRFDSDEFKRLFDDYNKRYTYYADHSDMFDNVFSFQFANRGALASQKLILSNGSAVLSVDFDHNVMVNHFNTTPKYTALRSYENPEGYSATPMVSLAINANSDKKEKAFEFIKYALSPQIQASQANRMYISGFFGYPVRLESRDQLLEFFRDTQGSNTYFTQEGAEVPITPVSDEFFNSAKDIVTNITSCSIKDTKLYSDVFYPVCDEYDAGKITLDEFAKTLSEKTNLYLNE